MWVDTDESPPTLYICVSLSPVTYAPVGGGGGGGGAPTDAEYIVGASNGTLTAERVVTNTATVTWDLATAGEAKANVPDNAITDAKLRDSAANSVIGRASATAGDPADITASDNTVLGRAGGNLTFAQVATAQIANDAVTYAKIQNVSATDRVLGRASTGAGDIEEITCTAFGRSLIDDADADAGRATLNAQVAVQFQDEGTNIGTAGAITTVNFTGAGVTASHSSGTITVDIPGGGGGGGGAPTDAQYVTMALNSTLSAERVLAVESGVLSLTDGGANGNATIGVATNGIGNTKLRQGVATSVIGRSANTTGDVADIQATANDRVLRRVGDALGFGQLTVGMFPANIVTFSEIQQISTDRLLGRDSAGTGNVEQLTVGGGIEFTDSGGIRTSAFTGDVTKSAGGTTLSIANDAVTNAHLRNSVATSVIGRSANTAGDPGDIQATANDRVLRRVSDALDFGQLTVNMAPDDLWTYAKIQNVSATDRLLGRASAGAGDIEEITCTSFARSLLDDADAATARTTLSAQAGIQFQDEGTNIGTSGAVTTVNFTGAGVTASHSSGTVTVTISGGGGGGGSPGGSSGNVQYNDAGSFGGEAAFTYDAANDQLTVPGLTVNEDLALAGDISPSTITSNQNDYNPTGAATATRMRLSSDAARTITGLAGGADGRVVILTNVGSFNITLANESTSSSAANRFAFPSGDFVIQPGISVTICYDSTSSRWRPLNRPGDTINDLTEETAVDAAADFLALWDASAGTTDKVKPENLQSGEIRWSGIQSLTATSNQNDLGTANVSQIRFAGTASILITGLANGSAGRVLEIANETADQVLGLVHESSSSTAANRFDFSVLGRGEHLFLFPRERVLVRYDNTSSRWRLMSPIERRTQHRFLAALPASGTTINSLGLTHTSAGGTISHPTLATTNYFTSQHRARGATGTTSGTQSGTRTQNFCWRGNAAGLGGFYVRFRWGKAANPSGDASFVGLFNSAAPGNVDPNTLLNAVGFQYNPSETTWRIGSNDGTGTATRTDLGSNYPVNTTAVFEGHLWAAPNASAILYAIWRPDDLTVAPAVGSLTSDLPSNTQLLAAHVWTCNRAASADSQIDWMGVEARVP
ncbi:MAG: hypothetical protein NZ534_00055 [Bacteroidia bacterium]|nr:hypothetical protein [Bacteroidia bacterium]